MSYIYATDDSGPVMTAFASTLKSVAMQKKKKTLEAGQIHLSNFYWS